STPVFKTGAFNRSAILPRLSGAEYNIVFIKRKPKLCKLLSRDDILFRLLKLPPFWVKYILTFL
ncbi:MAG: hypothetical protein MR034_02740, partial [Actinobacillus porcinus]|nr:hypothetical protein [Actinobacillus porcinus]